MSREEMRAGDRCLPLSLVCTDPFMYCTNWMAWPSGSVTTKLRLPLPSASTFFGTSTPLVAR